MRKEATSSSSSISFSSAHHHRRRGRRRRRTSTTNPKAESRIESVWADPKKTRPAFNKFRILTYAWAKTIFSPLTYVLDCVQITFFLSNLIFERPLLCRYSVGTPVVEALPPFLVHLIIIKDVIKRNSLICGGGLSSSCMSSPIISRRARHLSVSSRDIRLRLTHFPILSFWARSGYLFSDLLGRAKWLFFERKGRRTSLIIIPPRRRVGNQSFLPPPPKLSSSF